MLLKLYFLVSFILAATSVLNAYVVNEEFYKAMIYLFSNKFSKLIFFNMALMLALVANMVVISFFFGEIKEIERVVSYEPPHL